MKRVSIEEVRFVAFELARQKLAFDEPIPDFDTRYPNVLESCLATPFQSVFGYSPYPTLVSRASALLYLLIKNHPFQNGNKRIAITVLLAFLAKHDKWLRVDLETLYDFTLWVASSRPREKPFVMLAIQAFIAKHLIAAK